MFWASVLSKRIPGRKGDTRFSGRLHRVVAGCSLPAQPKGAGRDLEQEEILEILAAARRGDEDAVERLFPMVYTQLRHSARRELRKWRPGGTLNTTALVHEAYIKLVGRSRLDLQDRNHFFALSATAMRQIVVDHARRRRAQKRGGDETPLPIHESRLGKNEADLDVLDLDRALEALTSRSQRLGKLVELRFFGGLTFDEAADVLGMSKRTAHRDWRKARAFLYAELGGATA